jgi:hypothetical protein
VNDQHNHLRELIIKLQRSYYGHSLAESQAVPDLVMNHQANSVDKNLQPPNADCPEDNPACENGEPKQLHQLG